MLQYAIRADEIKQDGSKFIGTNQPFHYAEYVNIFVGNEHIIKKNTVSVEVASEENDIQVNYDKTKHMVMF